MADGDRTHDHRNHNPVVIHKQINTLRFIRWNLASLYKPDFLGIYPRRSNDLPTKWSAEMELITTAMAGVGLTLFVIWIGAALLAISANWHAYNEIIYYNDESCGQRYPSRWNLIWTTLVWPW